MSKTETDVSNLKINRGTYAKIQENISSIGENELIITTDKNVPIPTAQDAGKIVGVDSNGEYELQTPGGGTEVEANPTVPAGTTPSDLTGLKVGSDYYKIDKPIHFIKLTSTTLAEALRNEILSDDYFVILEYNNNYYYEVSKTSSKKYFETLATYARSAGVSIGYYNEYITVTVNYIEIKNTDTSFSSNTNNQFLPWRGSKLYSGGILSKPSASSSNATPGQVLTADGNGGTSWSSLPSGVDYITTAPTEANTSGRLLFVVLDSEPATYYDGYLYIIAPQNS